MKRVVLLLTVGVLVLAACAKPAPGSTEPAPSQAPLPTYTLLPTQTAYPTQTPYPTYTSVPAALPTPASERPRTLTAPSATPTPTLPDTPPSDCSHVPLGGFNDVWRNEQVYPRLGCAVAPAEAVTGTETYLCDGTHTLWLSEKRLFVVIPAWPYPWRFVADESNLPGDVSLMEEPVPWSQPCFPVSGRHGWLVRLLNPDSANELWARTNETSFSGAIQQFEGGWLFWNGNVCFVLFEDSTWTMF